MPFIFLTTTTNFQLFRFRFPLQFSVSAFSFRFPFPPFPLAHSDFNIIMPHDAERRTQKSWNRGVGNAPKKRTRFRNLKISYRISGFQARFQDFTQDFEISMEISGFHRRFRDFN